MPRVVRKLGRLLSDLVRSPRQTVRTLPALAESARMRLMKDSRYRRRADVLAACALPAALIDRVLEIWRPRSVLDVGCGPGVVIDYLLARGIDDVQGLEGSALAIEMAKNPGRIKEADLAIPVDLGRKFDLVYSVEVAEHIRPEAADEFVNTCVRHADRILFTAAHPGQGGLGHLNEQPREYWIAKFAERGFRYNAELSDALRGLKEDHPTNLMLFERD
jgi:SAM-dependent methyltransferase